MGGIFGHGDGALKFTGAAIRRISHGRSVFGRAPKMPIVAVNNPNFDYFTNPVGGGPTTKTHHLLGGIQQIRQAHLIAYFSGGLKLALGKRIRESRNGEFTLRRTVFR